MIGAQAAILYGSARATADIDVTIEPRGQSNATIAKALTAQGFDLVVKDESFIRQTRVLPIQHELGVPVDITLAGPGLEDMFFERARHHRVGAIDLPVVSPEDLVVMKVLAGRDKDVEDIRAVMSALGPDMLRFELIEETLRMLEEALGQSDLLPLFNRLRRESSPSM